jgi:hypothetical protein
VRGAPDGLPERRPATPEEWDRREEIMAEMYERHSDEWASAIPVEELLARRRARIEAAD